MRHLVFPPLSPHPTYPQLKICGMRAPQNIQDVAATQPTLMGFIFTSHSPRYVDTAETAEIVRILPPNIRKIGVFVNQATPTMLKTAQTFRLDGLQLHGDEPPEQLHEIRQQEPHLVLIKAFGIHPTFTFPTLHAYAPLCDLFLFDTHSKDYGGTGRTFDWNLLQNVTTQVPFLLAGGLDATQLQHIRAHLDKATPALRHLFGFDINSKVELAPGVKDLHKVRAVQEVLQQWHLSKGSKALQDTACKQRESNTPHPNK